MKLLEQLLAEYGADVTKSITLVPGFCCFICGVKTITSFSPENITVAAGKLKVTVLGAGMEVGSYFEGDLMVKGDVRGITID